MSHDADKRRADLVVAEDEGRTVGSGCLISGNSLGAQRRREHRNKGKQKEFR